VSRRFRGVEYRIAVRNPQGVNRGVKSLLVNGKPVPGDTIPIAAAGPVNVEVTLG
jgi:cellobiose phosphorylase